MSGITYRGTIGASVRLAGLWVLATMIIGFGIWFWLDFSQLVGVVMAAAVIIVIALLCFWWVRGYVLLINDASITLRTRRREREISFSIVELAHGIDLKRGRYKLLYLQLAEPGSDEIVAIHRFGRNSQEAFDGVLRLWSHNSINRKSDE